MEQSISVVESEKIVVKLVSTEYIFERLQDKFSKSLYSNRIVNFVSKDHKGLLVDMVVY